jgi:hypothetical protein
MKYNIRWKLFVTAVLVALGCEGEPGSDETTGWIASALTTPKDIMPNGCAGAAGTGGGPCIVGREFSASCVVRDGAVDKMLVAGGYDGIDGRREVFLFDPAATPGFQWTQKASLPPESGGDHGRLEAEMEAIPGMPDRCLMVGGRASPGGALLTRAYYYDLSDDAWTHAGDLPVVNHALHPCGQRLAVVGGSNGTTPLSSIQAYDPVSNTWASVTNMTTAREFPAVATADFTKLLIAGGQSTSPRNTVELLQVDSNCVPTSPIVTPTTTLGAARSMAGAFPRRIGVNNEFIVAGGTSNGSNALATTDFLTVDWAAGTMTRVAGPSMTTARRRFHVVATSFTTVEWMVVGGQAANGTSVTKLRVWDGTLPTPAWKAEDTLITARYGAAVQYLPSRDKVSIAAGVNVVKGGAIALLRTSEESATQ